MKFKICDPHLFIHSLHLEPPYLGNQVLQIWHLSVLVFEYPFWYLVFYDWGLLHGLSELCVQHLHCIRQKFRLLHG